MLSWRLVPCQSFRVATARTLLPPVIAARLTCDRAPSQSPRPAFSHYPLVTVSAQPEPQTRIPSGDRNYKIRIGPDTYERVFLAFAYTTRRKATYCRTRAMVSPWKKQPEDVVDCVLKRAEVSKVCMPRKPTTWPHTGDIDQYTHRSLETSRTGLLSPSSRQSMAGRSSHWTRSNPRSRRKSGGAVRSRPITLTPHRVYPTSHIPPRLS